MTTKAFQSRTLATGVALSTLSIALIQPTAAMAQATADSTAPAAAATSVDTDASNDIVVTGSRIDRAGFNAPTPTTVVGAADLDVGNRPSIAQALNDLPQFRASSTPNSTTANTNSGSSAMDLRGLGTTRTLTLLNNRRFTGSADLNNIPQGLVSRVDVVTGGASAAWGSGAIGGVVNIILDDNLDGLTLGAQTGISSRGDGARYSFDGTFGTSFADGRGHFMIGAEYQNNKGILDRFSRRNIGSSGLYTNPTYTPTNGEHRYFLSTNVFNADSSTGGLIVSGALKGQTFNSDGTLRPFQYGSLHNATSMIGGEGVSTTGQQALSAPYQRVSSYARASFEIGNAKMWADFSYARMWSEYNFYAENNRGDLTILASNPFLAQSIRDQLAAAGETSFKYGRVFEDYGFRRFDYTRQNVEGAVGIDGIIGDNGLRYSLYYTHGELRDDQRYHNQMITQNFKNAIDVVADPVTGAPVCRIALTNASTGCRPLNIFGEGAADPAAVNYVFGALARGTFTTKLDATGASLRGDLFTLPAGAVSFAAGVEARWESISTSNIDPVSAAGGFTRLNFSPLDGGFNVREGFGEVAVPIIDQPWSTLELSGAARYSDYSNSGGIWSWKLGATNRIFDTILLRVSRSRDIRSGSLTELFRTRATTYFQVADPETNSTYQVVRYGGGNPNLNPEVGSTLTLGAVFTPQFIPGFNLSVDYYDIRIEGAITTLTPQDIVTRCYDGNAALCNQITRVNGRVTEVEATFINLAEYRTKGVDIEASYRMPLSVLNGNWNGSLRLRALATYVDSVTTDDGVTKVDLAGDVGDNVTFGTPKWRGAASLSYEGTNTSLNLRVRYVGGGQFNHLLDIANNRVSSRTYVDLGGRVNIGNFTLFMNVNNVFDRDPPITTSGSVHYDPIGRYLSAGVKVRF